MKLRCQRWVKVWIWWFEIKTWRWAGVWAVYNPNKQKVRATMWPERQNWGQKRPILLLRKLKDDNHLDYDSWTCFRHINWSWEVIFQSMVSCVSSTAASEVPQAAGGDPAVEGAPPPEGRACQTAGAGDQEHQELPASELTLGLTDLQSHRHLLMGTHALLYKPPFQTTAISPGSRLTSYLLLTSSPLQSFNGGGPPYSLHRGDFNLNFMFSFNRSMCQIHTRCTYSCSCTYTQTLSLTQL